MSLVLVCEIEEIALRSRQFWECSPRSASSSSTARTRNLKTAVDETGCLFARSMLCGVCCYSGSTQYSHVKLCPPSVGTTAACNNSYNYAGADRATSFFMISERFGFGRGQPLCPADSPRRCVPNGYRLADTSVLPAVHMLRSAIAPK